MKLLSAVILFCVVSGLHADFTATRDVGFYLYTKSNPTIGKKITATTASISGSGFNAANPTRFVIHGYMSNYLSEMNTAITSAYFSRGNFNVIVVDWGLGSKDVHVDVVVSLIDPVSVVVANLINFLVSSKASTFNNIAIAGHSFGAHVAGLAGKKTVGGKVRAIIGLDPAGPFFDGKDAKNRLASTDGQYVEAIHTNIKAFGFGIKQNIGQADFYPNFGLTQPGCPDPDLVGCSHARAHKYFAESIRDNKFKSYKCGSYDQVVGGTCTILSEGTLMGGEPANYGSNGLYVLITDRISPYGKN